MFDKRIINYIKENLPELQELRLSVGGNHLSIGGYEMLNALIIHKNVLDKNNNSIAIYHPGDDLLDIYLLIIMGLVAYKQAIINNAKLRLNDFKIGELIEYNSKVAMYDGVSIDPSDNIERFKLNYNDRYKTSESLPLRFLPAVFKYSGTKTEPDPYENKKTKKDAKDVLRVLLGFQGKEVGLSGYPAFLVSSERPHLLDILKNVELNGRPFFEIFPSVKCTKGNRQRLGRDMIKRAYMFYFVSGLSTADDVLETEPSIKTLFVDAQGKSLRDMSLVSSIRSQYEIEDIYWLQNYNQLDLIEKLDKGLGFKVWIWDKSDFKELYGISDFPQDKKEIADSEYVRLVNRHNNVISRLAVYEDIFVEIGYPQGITLEIHKKIQTLLHNMFSESEEYKNNELLIFSIRAAGVANKIFQSPIPVSKIDAVARDSGGKIPEEDVRLLKDNLEAFKLGIVPEDFKNKAAELISLIEYSTLGFSEHYDKCIQAAILIMENKDKRVCVLTKYPQMLDDVKKIIMSEMEKAGHGGLSYSVGFTDNLVEATSIYDTIIWTFKPKVNNLLMLEPLVERNFVLAYPLQKQVLERFFAAAKRHLSGYLDSGYRAGILKVPAEILENVGEQLQQYGAETEYDGDFDIENILSSALLKAVSYQGGSHSGLVKARLVLFSDNKHSFFRQGNNIKVLDLKNETIIAKTVDGLSEGDEIVFLRDSKRTVFEELVEFYEHKPRIINLVKLSEIWRVALLAYCKENNLGQKQLKKALDEAGLERHPVTINSWLGGDIICPSENNYTPVDIIAKMTKDVELNKNLKDVKSAARKIHALRIKIGRYLSKKITQSYISPDSVIDDPILRNKLDEMSSHVRIARVSNISGETTMVPVDITNKLLTTDDI